MNQPKHTTAWPRNRRRLARRPRGITLLVVLVTMLIVEYFLLGVVESQTVQYSALNNTINYDKALYLAGAGAHAALAQLEANSSWNAGIPSTEFPSGSGNTYSATVATSGSNIIVTGTGVAGGVTRKLTVTINAS